MNAPRQPHDPTALAGLAVHLARAAEEADALVDLSNVVRDTRLGGGRPRALDRLRLVIEALARRAGDRGVTVYAVADRSLRHGAHEYADPGEPRLLASWVRDGLVEELADADERLLELTEMTGLPVISQDGFADFRLSHPWIQGNTTQFLAALPTPVRTVKLRERDMGCAAPRRSPGSWRSPISRRTGCSRSGTASPGGGGQTFLALPGTRLHALRQPRGQRGVAARMRRGVPVCELHRVELADDGPRTGVAQLKLLVGGECVRRFTLDVGTTAVLGRALTPGHRAVRRAPGGSARHGQPTARGDPGDRGRPGVAQPERERHPAAAARRQELEAAAGRGVRHVPHRRHRHARPRRGPRPQRPPLPGGDRRGLADLRRPRARSGGPARRPSWTSRPRRPSRRAARPGWLTRRGRGAVGTVYPFRPPPVTPRKGCVAA
ncbi:FHA domain-containing protein [Streptomyces sp. M19]